MKKSHRKKIGEHINKYDREFVLAELEEAIIDELMELNYDVNKLPLQKRVEVRLKIRKHSKSIFKRILGAAGNVLEEVLEIAVQSAIKEVEQIITNKLS